MSLTKHVAVVVLLVVLFDTFNSSATQGNVVTPEKVLQVRDKLYKLRGRVYSEQFVVKYLRGRGEGCGLWMHSFQRVCCPGEDVEGTVEIIQKYFKLRKELPYLFRGVRQVLNEQQPPIFR